MQCPVCSERLREVEKYGVTLDFCPGCKGAWLDRGKLEQIVGGQPEKIKEVEQPSINNRSSVQTSERREQDVRNEKGNEPGKGRRERGSWLSDVFESIGGGD